jgi:hypothetical protein
VDVLAAAPEPAPAAPPAEEVVSVREAARDGTNTVPPEAGVP